jgi:hypothetical protein
VYRHVRTRPTGVVFLFHKVKRALIMSNIIFCERLGMRTAKDVESTALISSTDVVIGVYYRLCNIG